MHGFELSLNFVTNSGQFYFRALFDQIFLAIPALVPEKTKL